MTGERSWLKALSQIRSEAHEPSTLSDAKLDFDRLARAVHGVEPVRVTGRVREVVGLAIRAAIPGARIGEVVEIDRRDADPMPAEVVGFHVDDATLLPFGTTEGIGMDDPVRVTGRSPTVRCAMDLLGRVLDGLGDPIDGQGPVAGDRWELMRDAPTPLERPKIRNVMPTGIRAIDGLMTIGEGQRVGLFAGSGVGKSTLLGQLARQVSSDIVVVCLIGERGREVVEFLEDSLGNDARKRTIAVVATSDMPALVRMRSAWVATAISEWFRDRGYRVMLLMDSLTRFARAGREVGLAAGEPPTRRGYPPSVFAALPRLLERSGRNQHGSITALYSVLVEGGDMEEPIADEVRGILDGHIVLDRELAGRGRWPAIDPVVSLSRVMNRVTTNQHQHLAQSVRSHLSTFESKRDLVLLGAYQSGSDKKLDAALSRHEALERFLCQHPTEYAEYEKTLAMLQQLA